MGKKVVRNCVLVLTCGSMAFAWGFGCLGNKFLGRTASYVVGETAQDMLDVFVWDGVTRGQRVNNAIADQAASNAACATGDGTVIDGCIADGVGPGIVPFFLSD